MVLCGQYAGMAQLIRKVRTTGRVLLGPEYVGKSYLVQHLPDGDIRLTLVRQPKPTGSRSRLPKA